MGWLILFLAILFEISGTIALKVSYGFSKLWPSILVVLFYGLSFYCLSHALKSIDMSVAYATWSGIGIATLAVVAYMYFHEPFGFAKAAWILMIVVGIIGLNLSGKVH